MSLLQKKYCKLKRQLNNLGSAVIAFSGGVDSSLLAKVAFDCLGKNAVAVTAKSITYSCLELKEANAFVKSIGIKHLIIDTGEFKNKRFINNQKDRCFFCKQELFSRLKSISVRLGLKYILDGTNKDDAKDIRPGQKANKQFNVISPLRDAGLTKEEIRSLCKKLGIDYQKPQGACLASRIPFGEKITKQNLMKVARSEELLRDYFGSNVLFRAREHKEILRIEIAKKDWTKLKKSDINSLIHKLKKIGYKYITLDLEGYIPAGLHV
jgi:uncharacterized protein